MARTQTATTCAVLAMLLSATAAGETVSVPLPELLSYTKGNKVVYFDAGVQFESISHARIHLEGTVTPGIWNYTNPATGTSGQMAVPTYFGPGLGPNFNFCAIAEVPNPVNGTFTFEPWLGPDDYSFLLDGQDKINMTLMYVFSGNLNWGSSVSAGSATITSAMLLIDGVVTPEPATLSLLVIGCLTGCRLRHS